jgi:hypothetical protein
MKVTIEIEGESMRVATDGHAIVAGEEALASEQDQPDTPTAEACPVCGRTGGCGGHWLTDYVALDDDTPAPSPTSEKRWTDLGDFDSAHIELDECPVLSVIGTLTNSPAEDHRAFADRIVTAMNADGGLRQAAQALYDVWPVGPLQDMTKADADAVANAFWDLRSWLRKET